MSFQNPDFTPCFAVIAGGAAAAQTSIRRPSALIRAARAGQSGWRRGRGLRRILKCENLPAPEEALRRLTIIEEALNEARLSGQAGYDLARHVTLMIAILAEMNLIAAARRAPGAALRPVSKAVLRAV
ncbi:MAG: DUF6477 family protein [Paracoccus sp. (in: a-proteobacteria)]|nr:DUF6477 family protein [Paracoccus sp. (in: a-proteobacteria)]